MNLTTIMKDNPPFPPKQKPEKEEISAKILTALTI